MPPPITSCGTLPSHPNPAPDLLADCAADAALVSLSTREPSESRGSILATAYAIRFTFSIVAAAIVAFCYNGPSTGGSVIATRLEPSSLVLIACVLLACALAACVLVACALSACIRHPAQLHPTRLE